MGCGAIAAQAGTRVTSQNHEWTLENAKLRVTVDALAGSLAVLDKTCGHEWRQPPVAAPTEPKFTEVQSVGKPPKGIRFVAGFGMFGEPRTRLTVTVELPDDSADMLVTADMPDRATKIGEIPFLRPLMLDTPDAAVLVSAHCNGHAYPVNYKPFPVPSLLGWRLDMPWVGLCDMKTGLGYMVILETSDDCMVRCDSQAVGNRSIVAPQFNWVGSLGAFAYPRRLLYHFTAKGGYVALAKRYRTYVAGQGVLVPFTEKVKKNPNLERLFGARTSGARRRWRSPGQPRRPAWRRCSSIAVRSRNQRSSQKRSRGATPWATSPACTTAIPTCIRPHPRSRLTRTTTGFLKMLCSWPTANP